MKFPDLLIEAIRRSEIPLRFEPGAEEAVAVPVMQLIRAWVLAHSPTALTSEFADGQEALIQHMVQELEGSQEVPGL